MINSGANVRIFRLTVASGKLTAAAATNGTNGSGSSAGGTGNSGAIGHGGGILNNGSLSLFKVVMPNNQITGSKGGNGGNAGVGGTGANGGGNRAAVISTTPARFF